MSQNLIKSDIEPGHSSSSTVGSRMHTLVYRLGDRASEWLYHRSSHLFGDGEENGTQVLETVQVLALSVKPGQSVEWDLDQGFSDVLQVNILSGTRALVPRFIKEAYRRIRKFMVISIVTDEVLDEEESNSHRNSAPAVSRDINKFAYTLSKVSKTAKPVFYGFITVLRKISRKTKSAFSLILGSAFRNSLRKAVFSSRHYSRSVGSKIRGPD